MATFEKGVKESAAKLDGSGLRIAIVHTRWNYALVDQMYKVVYDTLVKKHGVLPENIYTVCLSRQSMDHYSYHVFRILCLVPMNFQWLPSN